MLSYLWRGVKKLLRHTAGKLPLARITLNNLSKASLKSGERHLSISLIIPSLLEALLFFRDRIEDSSSARDKGTFNSLSINGGELSKSLTRFFI